MPILKKRIGFIVAVLIAQSAGLIGSVFTASSVASWYPQLIKPNWNPPSWVFAPAWILLYTLMGVASYFIWQKRKESKKVKIALIVYGFQLGLNALWSILFFGLRNPGIAFVEIVILWLLILITTILFWRIDKKAGILFLPYIVWVSFATYLNYTIWLLN